MSTPQKPHAKARGCLTGIVLVVAAIVAISIATSSGSSSGPPLPEHFRPTNADISAVTINAINGGDSPGINGTPTSSCEHLRHGLACTVAYAVKEPGGISNDLELFQPTRPIFKALFGVAIVRRVTVQVSGPTTSVGGKSSTSPLFYLTCDRAANAQINWNAVTESGLKQLCQFTPMVGGL